MRHQKSGRKFSRKSGPRHALLSNLVQSLIEHERIQTTDAKAKELRKIAERTISWATSVGNLVGNDKADAADKARIVHAMRQAQRIVKHKPILQKLFEEVGPRFVGRAGGFTRIMKLGYRHGDAAPVSIIELVDFAEANKAAAEPEGEESTQAGKGKKKAAKAEGAEAAAAAPAKKAPAKKKAAAKDESAAEAKPKKAPAQAKKTKKTEE
jgi:large subunit ribosomal protein L17